MTDEDVDKLLSVQVPGGSSARDWFLPHETEKGLENVRNVVRLMVAAAQGVMTVQQEPVAWTDENFMTLYMCMNGQKPVI